MKGSAETASLFEDICYRALESDNHVTSVGFACGVNERLGVSVDPYKLG